MSGMETCVNPKCVDYQFMHPGMCSTNEEVEAQWRAGNAEPVDTGTATTDATPTPTDREGSGNAGADSPPSLFSFLKMPEPVNLPLQEGLTTIPAFTAGKHGYLVKITREQVETAEVFPLTIGQAESLQDRERRQNEAYAKQVKEWEALQEKHPELGPIIKLHAPNESLECQGCDGGPDYGGDWPCRTIETIQEEMATPKRHPIYKRTSNPIMHFDPGCA